ncbi:MAG: hypothetical protein ACI86M_001266 [Saprospiraceae bacterium]
MGAFDPAAVTTIGGNLEIAYSNFVTSDITDLSDLSNIANVANVDGRLRIMNNENLTNVDGLSSLTTIGRALSIEINENLILKFSDACVGVIKRCFCIKTPYHKKDPNTDL